jgi:hypothetical protein
MSKTKREPTEEEKAGMERMLANAQDHAKRGGPRGRYPGEGLNTAVLMMLDPSKGYVQDNTQIVCLGALLLFEAGFSGEEIRAWLAIPALT